MKRKLIISIFIFLILNSLYVYAKDISFTKENINAYNISSSISQNDSELELTLKGYISIKNFTYFDESELLDFSSQDIEREGFGSYFNSNYQINNNIKISSNYVESAQELVSNISIDLNTVSYIKGYYDNKNFIVSTSSIIPHSLGFYGNNPLNQSKSFPFETVNDLGILSCNFSINNISYVRNSSNIITEIKCDFTYNCNYNKTYLDYYKNLYILINPIKNKYYISNLIDLKDYVVCNHKYIIDYSKINPSGHSVYCDKCKWTKLEEHKFVNLYDGLNSNQCNCGFNKFVNVFVYDENNSQIFSKVIDSFSTFSSENKNFILSKLKKDGYKILKFSEYKYIPENENYATNNYSWVNTGYVSNLPDMTNNVSLKYYPEYEKIENNKNHLASGGGSSASIGNGNEIEKNELKLFSEVSISPLEQLLGETPTTETANNIIYISSNRSYTSYEWIENTSTFSPKNMSVSSYYDNSDFESLNNWDDSGTRYIETLSDGNTFNRGWPVRYKDSDQNKAIATLSNLKFRQDNDFYYFDVNITYLSDNTFIKKNGVSNITNNGQLYLSNEEIKDITYDYMAYASGSRSKSFSGYASSGITTTSDSGNNSYCYQKIFLSINNGLYEVMQKSRNNGEQAESVYSANTPNMLYSTLKYPFEETLWSNVFTNAMRGYLYVSAGTVDCTLSISNPYSLFRVSDQPDLVTPHRPNNTEIEILNQEQSENNSLEYWNRNIKATIKVKKGIIENYKFLNMYAPQAVTIQKQNNINAISQTTNRETVGSKHFISHRNSTQGQTLIYSKSIHSENAINLTNYIHCDHEWYYYEKAQGDKVNHLKKCKFCEWEIEEPHRLTCEYDGYLNNLCEDCGYTDNVVIDIYSDDDQLVQERIGAYGDGTQLKSYTPYPSNFKTILDTFIHEKTGYLWKGYKTIKAKVPLSRENYSTAYTPLIRSDEVIKYINDFPPLIASKSTILQLNYEPIEYYIDLQSETNKGTYIFTTGLIETPFIYDKEYKIPIPSIAGSYTFVGWSRTQNSDVAEYTDLFKNLTTTDGDIVKLYPVLDEKHYKFKFSKINNLDIEIATNSNIDDLKCYFDTQYNLPNNIDVEGYLFKGWSLTEKGNNVDFIPNASLYNYTNSDNIYTLYPVYEPHKYIFNFSRDNILSLDIEQLEPQTFNYGEEKEIKDNYIVNGYVFKGWSLKATSSEIDFIPNQKIFNYTSENNKDFLLYPVYEELVFKINYVTSNGVYSNGSSNIIKSYTISSFTNFEIPTISKKQKIDKYGNLKSEDVAVFVSYKDESNIEYKTIDSFKQAIYSNNINNQIFNLYYNYMFVNNEIIRGGSSGGSESSGGGSSNSGNSIVQNNDIAETLQNNKNTLVDVQSSAYYKSNKSNKKKTIFTFISEVYDSYLGNRIERDKTSIYDFISNVYDNFVSKKNERVSLYEFISNIYEKFSKRE